MHILSHDLEKYLTGRRRLKEGFGGSPPKIKDYFCLFLLPPFYKGAFGGSPQD
jgi:hypothetical protein